MTELLQVDKDDKSRRGESLVESQGPVIPEPDIHPIKEESFRRSLDVLFINRNFTIFLATSWVFSTFNMLSMYLNIYLRVIGWSFITIGIVLSLTNAICTVNRLVGGYLGDVANRKRIAVAAQLIMAIYYIYIGLFADFWLIVVAFMIYSIHEMFRSGSSAYFMENVPREHSGFALSLFTAGRGLSIIGLVAFGFMVPFVGFSEAFRTMYFIAGLCLIVTSALRALMLEPKAPMNNTRRERRLIKDFLSENVKAAKLLLVSIPGLLSVVVLDALSDSFFKFSALVYAYEELSIDVAGINLMLLTQLLISVPLLLKMGRVTDRKGVKRAAFFVYSIMPLSALLLLLAPLVPYVLPLESIQFMNDVMPGFGVVFSTPFIGIVMKYVNDALWWGLILILIRKRMPETDTAKVLSVFWVLVYILASIGPAIAGVVYELMTPSILFATIIFLNMIILVAIAKGPFGNDTAEITKN